MTTHTPTQPRTENGPFAPSAFYRPDQPAPVPREPGLTDPHHRLLQNLSSPEVSTVMLCEVHRLTLGQIAELTGSATFEEALAAAERIASFRLRLLRMEAEQLAWARLADLARRNPITPAEQEISRKAAAQILRETKKKPEPDADTPPGPRTRAKDNPTPTAAPTPTPQRFHPGVAASPRTPINAEPSPQPSNPAGRFPAPPRADQHNAPSAPRRAIAPPG